MVEIKTLGKNILVRQLPSKNISDGGIIMAGKSKGAISDYENWLAEVISIGEKVKDEVAIEVGDIIMMDPSYAPVMFDDPNFVKLTPSLIQEDSTDLKTLTPTADPLMMAFVTYAQILSKITNK
jgi:co-chaperonin GroES (HSP10)